MCGYHVYGKEWTTNLGEQIMYEYKIGDVVDCYAVAVRSRVKPLGTCQESEALSCNKDSYGKRTLQVFL